MVMLQALRPIELTDTDIQTHPFPVPVAGPIDVARHRAAPGFTVAEDLPEAFQGLDLPQFEGAPPGLGQPGERPGSFPFMIFDGDLLHLRRLQAEQRERAWARLDLGKIDDDDIDQPLIGFNIINPAIWVQLLGGALTGSIERVGTEEADGEQLVHYRANFDYEKAFEDLDDDEFQQLTVLFEVMGIRSVVTPGEVWLDESGLPRRIIYRVEQRVDRTNAFALTLAFVLSDYGTDATVEAPGPDETVEVDGVLQLIGEFGADQLIESFRSQVPVPTPQAAEGAQ